MRAYEKTDFLESLEAGTLLLKSSNAEGYVEYTSEDGRTMRYLPYLPPNCYLMPIEEALGNRYSLSEFAKMSADFDKLVGCDSLEGSAAGTYTWLRMASPITLFRYLTTWGPSAGSATTRVCVHRRGPFR